MKQIKFYALVLLGIMLSINQVWAKSVTFTPGTDDTSTAKDGVSITMSNTTGGSGYYQAYASSNMVVSSTNGNIASISFTCTASGTSKYGPGNFTANTGTYTYDGTAGSWTGDAASVTLSASAQVRMYAITITYGSSTTYTDLFSYIRHRVACLYRAVSPTCRCLIPHVMSFLGGLHPPSPVVVFVHIASGSSGDPLYHPRSTPVAPP